MKGTRFLFLIFLLLAGMGQIIRAEAQTDSQDNKIVVTGTVFDSANIPVAGANLMVKGTDTGTIADGDGNFTITVPYSGATLDRKSVV